MAAKVLIATPHGRNLVPEYVLSCVAFFKGGTSVNGQKTVINDYCFDYYLQEGLYIHFNRNEICKLALIRDYEYLIQIDGDMFFLKEDIFKLLDLAREHPWVGGVYPKRGMPFEPTVWDFNDNGFCRFIINLPQEPFEADGVATGFMMLRRDLLLDVYADYINPWAYGDSSEGKDLPLGEDVWFAKRMNDRGIRAMAMPNLGIQHCGHQMFGVHHLRESSIHEYKPMDGFEPAPDNRLKCPECEVYVFEQRQDGKLYCSKCGWDSGMDVPLGKPGEAVAAG